LANPENVIKCAPTFYRNWGGFMLTRRLTLVCVVLLSVIGLSISQPVSAQSLGGFDAYVATNTLSLRVGPSQRAASIVVLKLGDRMYLDGRDASQTWVHVKTEYDQVGWVNKNFLVIAAKVVVFRLPVLDANAPTSGGSGGGSNPGTSPTAAPSQPTVPPPVPGGRTGGSFELGGQVRDLNDNVAGYMRRAKMKWVKRQAFAGDGSVVGLINQAHAYGFKILLSVIGDKKSITDDGYQNSYAGYVADLAGAGADAIEVWNEQNIDREWPTGQINPAKYVPLLAKSYNAIKNRNSNTIVIIGAPAPTGGEGAFGRDRVMNDDKYTAGMAAAGAGRYADCVGLHYNEGIVSPRQRSGDPRGDNYPTRYFSTMLARGLRGFRLPGCFTELGYLSPEGYGGLPAGFEWAQNVTVAQQAQWLAEAAVLASNSRRVRIMIIFNVDFTVYGADPQGGFAIIRPGGGCPACDSLGRVVR
jgi:hypothetical protein